MPFSLDATFFIEGHFYGHGQGLLMRETDEARKSKRHENVNDEWSGPTLLISTFLIAAITEKVP